MMDRAQESIAAQARGADPGPDPVRLDWGTRTFMLFGGILSALALTGITAVLPKIEVSLAHDAGEKLIVKMLVTGVSLVMVIGAPLASFLARRFDLRRVLGLFCLLYALAGTAGLYLGDIYALLGSRLLLGITGAGIATASMVIINTRLQGIARARWLSLHIFMQMAGSLVILPLVGLLGDLGWRWPFATYAVGLVLALIAMLGMRDEGRAAAAPTEHARSRAGGAFPYAATATAFAIGLLNSLPLVYLPFVIREMGAYTPARVSMAMLGGSAVGAVAALSYARVLRVLSPSLIYAVSFLAYSIGLTAIAVASDYWLAVVGMMSTGIGIGLTYPHLVNDMARRTAPEQLARNTGILKAALYLSGPSGVLLVEPVLRRWGAHGVIAAVSMLAMLMLALFLVRAVQLRPRPGVAGRPALGIDPA